jgi:hypothetical protein
MTEGTGFPRQALAYVYFEDLAGAENGGEIAYAKPGAKERGPHRQVARFIGQIYCGARREATHRAPTSWAYRTCCKSNRGHLQQKFVW